MVKLGARDRAQLVVLAYESGLVRPGLARSQRGVLGDEDALTRWALGVTPRPANRPRPRRGRGKAPVAEGSEAAVLVERADRLPDGHDQAEGELDRLAVVRVVRCPRSQGTCRRARTGPRATRGCRRRRRARPITAPAQSACCSVISELSSWLPRPDSPFIETQRAGGLDPQVLVVGGGLFAPVRGGGEVAVAASRPRGCGCAGRLGKRVGRWRMRRRRRVAPRGEAPPRRGRPPAIPPGNPRRRSPEIVVALRRRGRSRVTFSIGVTHD